MRTLNENAPYSEYRSRMENWHINSSVRAKPMRKFTQIENSQPFSSDLIPLLKHQKIIERGDETKHILLAQKLYSYLAFTEHLERKAVIPTCVDLAHGEVPFLIPRSLQRDASKIIVDEAHHAECAGDLTDQMVSIAGVQPLGAREPAFMRELRREVGLRVGCDRRLVRLAFTAVSETLITSTLTKVPADRTVNEAIREVIMDHAIDEAKHHACFDSVIGVMWEGMNIKQRDEIGPLFAKFVCDFLAPDVLVEMDWLESMGFAVKEAKVILEETHGGDRSHILRAEAAPTIMLMRRRGLLDHRATEDSFAVRGLL